MEKRATKKRFVQSKKRKEYISFLKRYRYIEYINFRHLKLELSVSLQRDGFLEAKKKNSGRIRTEQL
jgi:hypothetical protein